MKFRPHLMEKKPTLIQIIFSKQNIEFELEKVQRFAKSKSENLKFSITQDLCRIFFFFGENFLLSFRADSFGPFDKTFGLPRVRKRPTSRSVHVNPPPPTPLTPHEDGLSGAAAARCSCRTADGTAAPFLRTALGSETRPRCSHCLLSLHFPSSASHPHSLPLQLPVCTYPSPTSISCLFHQSPRSYGAQK